MNTDPPAAGADAAGVPTAGPDRADAPGATADAPDAPTDALDALDAAFRAADQAFLHPPRVAQSHTFTLITLALFVGAWFVQNGDGSLWGLVILLGVLAFHELGHAAAMRFFGYSDVRVFFIPFFGAAAAGRSRGAAGWKQAVVLLMGPLPGIALGAALNHASDQPLVHTAALQLLLINTFNLVPISPLDGGQLFARLLFSRQRHLEVGFYALANLALIYAGYSFGAWVLTIVGGFMLSSTGARAALATAAHGLRPLGLPAGADELDEPQRRRLFAEARRLVPTRFVGQAAIEARKMEELHEHASRRPVPWGATALLLVVWLLGWGIAIAGVRR